MRRCGLPLRAAEWERGKESDGKRKTRDYIISDIVFARGELEMEPKERSDLIPTRKSDKLRNNIYNVLNKTECMNEFHSNMYSITWNRYLGNCSKLSYEFLYK